MIVNYLRFMLPYKTLVILISLFSFMMTPAFSMDDDIPKETRSKKKKIHHKKKKDSGQQSEPEKLDPVQQVLQTVELLTYITTFMDIETLAAMRLTSHYWHDASQYSWSRVLAERGDIEAHFALAQMHKEGTYGVKQSPEGVFYWYERLAQLPYPSKEKERMMVILSVDGGGIRGLIPARVIQHWEEKLEAKFGFEVHMADFVHVVAGTSTGSIIGLGLTVPSEFDSYQAKYPASQLVQLYKDKGEYIFPTPKNFIRKLGKATKRYIGGAKFDARPLENTLKEYFQTVMLSQATQNIHLLIPAYGISKPPQPMWFDGCLAKENPEEDVMMGDVARCSAAAPTYLKAGTIKDRSFVDGGLVQNNPSHKAYLRFGLPSKKDVMVISLGTGEGNKEFSQKLSDGSGARWAINIADVMMSANAYEVDDNMRLLEKAGSLTYYRIQASVENEVLDDASEKSIEDLIDTAKKLVKNNKQVKEVYKYLHKICLLQSNLLSQKIKFMHNFSVLDFSNLKVGGRKYFSPFIERLNSVQQLTHLYLRRCGLIADHTKELCAALNNNTTLVYLDLSENGIGPMGASHLGKLLKINKSLTELDLHCNGIGKGNSRASLSLFKRKRGKSTFLTSLNLSDNNISSEHFSSILEALTEVKDVSPLQTLILLDNNIHLLKEDKKKVRELKKKQISILFDKN